MISTIQRLSERMFRSNETLAQEAAAAATPSGRVDAQTVYVVPESAWPGGYCAECGQQLGRAGRGWASACRHGRVCARCQPLILRTLTDVEREAFEELLGLLADVVPAPRMPAIGLRPRTHRVEASCDGCWLDIGAAPWVGTCCGPASVTGRGYCPACTARQAPELGSVLEHYGKVIERPSVKEDSPPAPPQQTTDEQIDALLAQAIARPDVRGVDKHLPARVKALRAALRLVIREELAAREVA
jgi:hypothetical protein